ncbi:Fe2+-dicitrate sensor, membrane component [Bordetella genomosp. 10]|uniref:Fe2+-dicitrate sensor, membrane component n=1 Tax=Bordetella genomosp. 10 TaxID=1416804 RepID=A0A261SHM2_9BORD|nr:FecR domain-containing protein [Bordetella genomosp. 10]OZI36938.1 Fe2+-dicitrate sensor, membrane component [Bordetella genomosp. 10]
MNASLPARPLDRAVARAAAAWLVRLREAATPQDIEDCLRWRNADPEHERAWRLAQQLDAKFEVVPPRIGMAAIGRARRASRRAAIKSLAALLVAGSSGYLAYSSVPWRTWVADERTATGERRQVVLADGTRVDLNTATAIDVAFSETERRIFLRGGEVLVETGHDAGRAGAAYRPFIVQTRQGRIRALGTRFVVRDGADDTLVAVLQGAVELTPDGAPSARRVLDAGQQARFTAARVGAVAPADAHAADWARGMFVADQMRLADVVSELSRYRPGVLRCDPAVADLRLTGAFQLDNIDVILDALPRTLPVRVVYRTRYWVTVAAADTPAGR